MVGRWKSDEEQDIGIVSPQNTYYLSQAVQAAITKKYKLSGI